MALLDFTYPELEFQALNTPVEDWRTIFKFMQEAGLKTLLDAGAGNALSAQVAQKEFSNLFVHAWEIMPERLENINCPDHDVRVADLMTESLPKVDVLFLYLPTGPLLERILDQLKNGQIIIAVESHGELFSRLEESSNLKTKLSQHATRHENSIHVYEWNSAQPSLLQTLRSKSYYPSFEQILIKEEDLSLGESVWLADCYGLTATSDHYIETLFPPRRFKIECVQGFSNLKNNQILIERRQGKWRKILVQPEILIENEIGQRITIDGSKVALE